MSETLNVNVIVAAKDEYTKQLITLLQPEIYDLLRNVFINSQKNNLRRKLSYSNFQKELKQVPRWSNYTLEEYLQKINQKYPYLMDLITAIFVSHVKILACVRIKADDKAIKIKVPNLNNFLHKIIINTSEKIYYYPEIINSDKEKIFTIISTSIIDTISNQVPLEYILNEYLSGAFDEEESPFEKPLGELNNDNLYDHDVDEDLESNYENELKKDIPIGEISKLIPPPVTEQIQSVNLNENDNLNENLNENQNENENENENENLNVKNSESIEDSSDEEDEEDEEDDEEDDEDNKKTIKTSPALF